MRNEYRQREKESGENLVALYQAGNLTLDEFGIFVSDYARAMMERSERRTVKFRLGRIYWRYL